MIVDGTIASVADGVLGESDYHGKASPTEPSSAAVTKLWGHLSRPGAVEHVVTFGDRAIYAVDAQSDMISVGSDCGKMNLYQKSFLPLQQGNLSVECIYSKRS